MKEWRVYLTTAIVVQSEDEDGAEALALEKHGSIGYTGTVIDTDVEYLSEIDIGSPVEFND